MTITTRRMIIEFTRSSFFFQRLGLVECYWNWSTGVKAFDWKPKEHSAA